VRILMIAAGVCLLAGLTTTIALRGQPKGIDLSGTWQIDFQDDNGVSHSSPTLILKQEPDRLTGTFGKYAWPVIGAVDRNNVVFSFVALWSRKRAADFRYVCFIGGVSTLPEN
jgi:hypothetical protein